MMATPPLTHIPTVGHTQGTLNGSNMSVVSFEVVEGSEVQDLFETYGPRLLVETARWRVPPDERMSVVLTVLDDVVLRILKTGNEPDYMPTYLYAALRNRLRNRYRDH